MDFRLFLDVTSDPFQIAERDAERIEPGSPTGKIGIFRILQMKRASRTFHLVHYLVEIIGLRNFDKDVHVIQKSISGIDIATFSRENLYHPIEQYLFPIHWDGHLVSFGGKDEVVYVSLFTHYFQQNAPGMMPT